MRDLFAPVDIAGLAFFRVAFGLLLCENMARYWFLDAARDLYAVPGFHFTWLGFDWVRPFPSWGMSVFFAALSLLALALALGVFYRLAALFFFLGFTYLFLLDQARYLNHFYLICLLAFLMIFLPAARAYSIDSALAPSRRLRRVPAWTLGLLRAQIGVVYFFAGVAKLNGDWLRGEPLRAWLAERSDLSLVGPVLVHDWTPWIMSYGGVCLDLSAAPLLYWRRTRPAMLVLTTLFHLVNASLFSIGVFPWLMISATLLFCEPDWPRRAVRRLRRAAGGTLEAIVPSPEIPVGLVPGGGRAAITVSALALWMSVQVLVPLRHFLYPGDVNWTEEGHRFSWRMKLRSKEGWARFIAHDPESGRTWTIDPTAPESEWGLDGASGEGADSGAGERERAPGPERRGYLTLRQARKMSGVPAMVLDFGHHLAGKFHARGYARVEIRARVKTSLNGRRYQLLIDPEVDLAAQPRSLLSAKWILPLGDALPGEIRSGRMIPAPKRERALEEATGE